jgi:endonuclease/exonuclease/phosphatase family metal-dependent hydrolase
MRKIFLPVILFLLSCRPLVTTFDDLQAALYYTSSETSETPSVDSLKVMTWNIRFGAARSPWFEDSCGDRVLMTAAETTTHLQDVAEFIKSEQPDILLLQEVDVSSKRSAYIDQMQWLLDNTYFNYGVYASMWQAEVIPSGGLGRVDVGNGILSRWKLTDAERIQLSLRTDQDALTQYFYLRRNIVKAKVNLPGLDTALYAVNTHATAFATDDTKQKHIDEYVSTLADIHSAGHHFITGGDLNSIPPGAIKYDFCASDACHDEVYHSGGTGTDPHIEGSYFNNFEGERDLLKPLYDNYHPAIGQSVMNDSVHFTHSPWNTDRPADDKNYWDRKLDYLFTNMQDWSSTGQTYQNTHLLSDHAPVTAVIKF